MFIARPSDVIYSHLAYCRCFYINLKHSTHCCKYSQGSGEKSSHVLSCRQYWESKDNRLETASR